MKSLKLKKVKISSIGNPHILFGGVTAETCETQPPLMTYQNLECLKSLENKCDTVTNSITGQRTTSAIGGGSDAGGGSDTDTGG